MLIEVARPGMQAVRLAAACALLAWALGLVLLVLRPWHLVELKLFDLLTVARRRSSRSFRSPSSASTKRRCV